jgi:hypothetical protein
LCGGHNRPAPFTLGCVEPNIEPPERMRSSVEPGHGCGGLHRHT